MHQVKPTEPAERVRMEARLPVSIPNHGAAAPNPAELMPARPHWDSPLNPEPVLENGAREIVRNGWSDRGNNPIQNTA
jgi:hypothetical protein